MILHLGVVDIPYVRTPPSGRGRRRRRGAGGTQTTGDVAGWLEDRYHVMEHFAQLHLEDTIVPALEEGLAGSLESLMMGAPQPPSLFATGEEKIAERFRLMLDQRELDALGFPGIPTQASIDRASGAKRSARFKSARASGAAVSFVDSGLYAASMRAWVD